MKGRKRVYEVTYVSVETGRTIGTERVEIPASNPQSEDVDTVRGIGTRTAQGFTRTEGNVRWSFERG